LAEHEQAGDETGVQEKRATGRKLGADSGGRHARSR
jgi:hypothetical protein